MTKQGKRIDVLEKGAQSSSREIEGKKTSSSSSIISKNALQRSETTAKKVEPPAYKKIEVKIQPKVQETVSISPF